MRKPNRIVYVFGQHSVGGAEKQLAALIANQPERAKFIDVQTITFLAPNSKEILARYEELGVSNTLVDRQAMSFPAFLARLIGAVWKLRPAVLHTLLDSSTGTWGRLAAWLTRVPAIMHSDLLLATGGGRVHHLLRPFLDRVTTRFLPNAEAIADRIVATGVPRERITVIPCGVDLAVFNPDATGDLRESWGLPRNAVIAGFLGRFWQQKRVDLLLEALVQLPESRRPDYVVLAGDGPTMPMVRERIARDSWLTDRCRLLGTIHNVPEFLSSIDYLVLPADSEGLPNVILEALAMRRPVVATRVSDIPLVIADAGVVAEPGDVGSIANAIGQMQDFRVEERRQLGSNGRARVERDFDIVRVAERFWDIHIEMLAAVDALRVAGATR